MYNYIKSNRIRVLLIPLIIYWIILFIGTSIPSDNFSDILEVSDKLKHFLAYLGLAFLLSLNFYFQEKWEGVSKYFLKYTFIVISLYGLIDEIHQIFVPNRSAEFYDWLADLLGGVIGLFIANFFLKNIRKNKPSYETK